MQLKLNINREIDIITKYNLTLDEWFVLELLLLAIEGEVKEIQRYLLEYQNCKSVREILLSLQDKDIILKSYKVPNQGDEFKPDRIKFNQNFIKTYIKLSGELGYELFEIYPSFVNINGKTCSLKNISKGGFMSLEEFFTHYGKTIKFNSVLHEEIIDLVNWGKENDFIKYGILEFVASRKWLELKELKEGNCGMLKIDENI